MYTIGKPAEFGSNNLPIRGQCQPHTKGWQLRHFSRGEVVVLYEDNYYTCRELQKACAGLPLEEARAKVEELARSLTVDMQETQQIGAGLEETRPPGSGVLSDETPVDLPAVGNDSERDSSGSESTKVIPREEMEEQVRRQNRDGDSS